MIKNFENLPENILNKIFGYVYADRKYNDILQCELVCKKWMPPAQRSLYSTIILKDQQAVKNLQVAMNNKSSSCPGQYTLSLLYHGRSEVDGGNGASWINLFIDTFPNLRHIFSDIQGFRYYLALIKAHRLGKLKDLQSIGPCSKESANLHNCCVLLYKDNLTALNVRDNKKINMDTSLYERLYMFPKVKRLYVDTNLHNFFETSENATEAMPVLHGLFFENTETSNTFALAPYEPVNLYYVEPQINIKYLIVQSISYENDNFLLYLMKKFSALERIYINQNKDTIIYTSMLNRIKSDQNNFSVAVVSKFMAFLSKCDIYSIDLFYTTLNVDEILNSYWELCDKNESKIVSIAYEQEEDWQEADTHPAYCNSLSRMTMNKNSTSKEKMLHFTYEPCSVAFPHLRVLENTGNELDQFSLSMGSKQNEDVYECRNQSLIDIINGEHFSHIIKNCRELRSLKIHKARIILLPFSQVSIKHYCLTDLTLEEVLISEDILQQISNILPALKKLNLKNIHCNPEDNDYIAPKFNNIIDMPSTAFKYLSVQNYLLDSVFHGNYPSKLFIRVTIGDHSKYYKCTSCGKASFNYDLSDDESDEECVPESEIKLFDYATTVPEKEYAAGFNDRFCSTLHIKCKSLDYLMVSLSKINSCFGCAIILQNNNVPTDIFSKSREEIHEYFVKNI